MLTEWVQSAEFLELNKNFNIPPNDIAIYALFVSTCKFSKIVAEGFIITFESDVVVCRFENKSTMISFYNAMEMICCFNNWNFAPKCKDNEMRFCNTFESLEPIEFDYFRFIVTINSLIVEKPIKIKFGIQLPQYYRIMRYFGDGPFKQIIISATGNTPCSEQFSTNIHKTLCHEFNEPVNYYNFWKTGQTVFVDKKIIVRYAPKL